MRFFFLKGFEENLPLAIGFLKASCIWDIFLQFPSQDINYLRVAVINRTPGLVNKRCREHWWSYCSYREFPRGGSTF